ncbi:MAG: type II secretion system protein GspH [Gammaproteobacteria bacterium]|nr:type II secretion system protein GspH [Gammaproteobacteria bacterium]
MSTSPTATASRCIRSAPTARRAAKATMPISAANSARNRGFTLLEVLLVLAIVGLAGALLVPRLGGLDGRGFNVEVRSAANLLNHARRNAVVTGNPATVGFLPEAEDVEFDYSPPIFSAGVFNARNIELQFQDSTGMREPVLEPLEITFFPEGGSTGGALLLLRGELGARIEIDPFTGRINANEQESIR